MTAMVFLIDLLNMLELILNRLLKYFSSAKKLKNLNLKSKLLLKTSLLLSKKFKVEKSSLSLSLPQFLSLMMSLFKLLLAKISKKLFLIQKRKY